MDGVEEGWWVDGGGMVVRGWVVESGLVCVGVLLVLLILEMR